MVPGPSHTRGFASLTGAPPGYRLVAIRTVDRLIRTRRKWHLRCLATLRTYGIEHRALATATTAVALACSPALRAAGGLVLETLLRIELLFACRKCKFRAAVTAGEVPVLKSHVSPQFHLSEITKPACQLSWHRELTRNLACSSLKSNLGGRSSPAAERTSGA